MPKTNLCKPRVDPREERKKDLEVKTRELLKGKLAGQKIKQVYISDETGIPKSTLSGILNNPRKMKLGQLWDILDILKIDDTEKARIL